MEATINRVTCLAYTDTDGIRVKCDRKARFGMLCGYHYDVAEDNLDELVLTSETIS